MRSSCLLFGAVLISAVLGNSVPGHAEGVALKVAALHPVVADLARQVGEGRAEVVDVVKPGMDPHAFEPGPKDIKDIADSDILLAAGLGFEGYLSKLKSSLGGGPVFVEVGSAVKPLMAESTCEEHDHEHEHDPNGQVADPHWWHSIANAKVAVRLLRDQFAASDPEGAGIYKTNAGKVLSGLNELEEWTRITIARLPKSRRVLVTSHDALGYFAKDYGFEILPVQGINPTDQPSSQKVKDLIEEIRAKNVKAIFAENIENPKVLEEITKETGARIGGVLYADSLGEGDDATFEGMFRHNVTTVVTALE